MQIRLDKHNAAAVRKEALAHRRVFKRKCSFADVVNKRLRGTFSLGGASNTVSGINTAGSEPIVQNAVKVFGWDNPK